MPHLAVSPPAVVQRQSADWGLVQPERVETIRHEPFDYEFKGTRLLLIATERAERHDGETILDGLPRSTCREWNRKMTLVPAGHRFYGWQKPRSLLRSTFLYIDTRSSLLSELRFAEVDFRPRLFFFDPDLWATALKLKAQLEHRCRSQGAYVEALGIALAQRADERDWSICRVGHARRASRVAAKEIGAIHRRAPCRRALAVVFGSARAAQPVSFFPSVQGIVRHAATPISDEPTN